MRRRAFSIIELVMVVAIIGIVAAIAIPRMTGFTERAIESALVGDVARVSSAIEHYKVEHAGQHPAHTAGKAVDTDGGNFMKRLLLETQHDGTLSDGSLFGPYLRSFPRNPYNGYASVRIGGAVAGAGTHGWRFDPTTEFFEPDHTSGSKGGGAILEPVVVKAGESIDLGGGASLDLSK